MSKTITVQHTWVKHTITPVSVLSGIDGEPVVFVDPDQQVLSEQTAVYGCVACNEPMAGNHNTECQGEEEDEPQF